MGKKEETLKYYEEALDIFQKEVGDRRGEGTVLNNLGDIYGALYRVQIVIGHKNR